MSHECFMFQVSAEKSLSKEEIQVEQIPLAEESKILTTFAALKEESSSQQQQSSAKKSILDPIVCPYELNNVSELDTSENNEATEPSPQTLDAALDNELKEFVKQRYQKRYRSKFRKSSSNLIDETIIEETDQDLIEAESDDLKDEPEAGNDMFKKHLKTKPKKEVTFKSEPKTIHRSCQRVRPNRGIQFWNPFGIT